jgi:hypothetical protein
MRLTAPLQLLLSPPLKVKHFKTKSLRSHCHPTSPWQARLMPPPGSLIVSLLLARLPVLLWDLPFLQQQLATQSFL